MGEPSPLCTSAPISPQADPHTQSVPGPTLASLDVQPVLLGQVRRCWMGDPLHPYPGGCYRSALGFGGHLLITPGSWDLDDILETQTPPPAPTWAPMHKPEPWARVGPPLLPSFPAPIPKAGLGRGGSQDHGGQAGDPSTPAALRPSGLGQGPVAAERFMMPSPGPVEAPLQPPVL